MRLIDADELLKYYSVNEDGQRIPERDCDNFPLHVNLVDIKQTIRQAPTIESRSSGKWSVNEFGHFCTACGEYVESPAEGYTIQYKFCPNCGVEMVNSRGYIMIPREAPDVPMPDVTPPSPTVSEAIWDSWGTFTTTKENGIYMWLREQIPDKVYRKLEPNTEYCLVTKLYKVDKE